MARRKKTEDKEPADIVGDHSATLARDDAASLVAAINAPVDDPGGHHKAAIMASAEAGGTPFCPICGTIRTTDVCPVDGHRFEAA